MRAFTQMLPCTAFLGALALGPAAHAQQEPPPPPAAQTDAPASAADPAPPAATPPQPAIQPAPPAPPPLLPVTPSPEAVEAYQQQRLGLNLLIWRSNLGHVRREIQAYQGPHKRALRTDTFFLELGRPDLANRYRQQRQTRTSLMIAGGALAGAGLITLVAGVSLPNGPSPAASTGRDAHPNERNNATLYTACGGALLMAVSGSLFAAAGSMRLDPLSASEAQVLVDAHNRRLRQKLLGLGAREVLRTTTLTPHASPTGAGLTLGMRLW